MTKPIAYHGSIPIPHDVTAYPIPACSISLPGDIVTRDSIKTASLRPPEIAAMAGYSAASSVPFHPPHTPPIHTTATTEFFQRVRDNGVNTISSTSVEHSMRSLEPSDILRRPVLDTAATRKVC